MIEDNAVVTYHDVSLSVDTEGRRFPVLYIASEGHGGGYLRMSVEEAHKLASGASAERPGGEP